VPGFNNKEAANNVVARAAHHAAYKAVVLRLLTKQAQHLGPAEFA